MRLGFRKAPSDLVLAAALALTLLPLALADIGGAVRFTVALIVVLFLPGYVVLASLFPRNRDMTWVHRIAISAGLSIACVALLGILVDLTPEGLTLGSTVTALLLFTFVGCGVAWVRRIRVPPQERLELSLHLAPPRWHGLSRTDRILAVCAALALTSAAGAIAFGVANPPAPERFTEFYLLDASGAVLAYPLTLNTTAQGSVIVGIHDMEGRGVNYTVIVLLVTLGVVYNDTTGQNDTIAVSTAYLGSFPVNVPSGGRSEQPYAFNITVVGEYQMRFLLFKGPPQGNPYRFVAIRIHVS